MELDEAKRNNAPQGKCFNCGKEGHYASKCQAPKKGGFRLLPERKVQVIERQLAMTRRTTKDAEEIKEAVQCVQAMEALDSNTSLTTRLATTVRTLKSIITIANEEGDKKEARRLLAVLAPLELVIREDEKRLQDRLHAGEHFTFCYDDGCLVHKDAKDAANYYPTKRQLNVLQREDAAPPPPYMENTEHPLGKTMTPGQLKTNYDTVA